VASTVSSPAEASAARIPAGVPALRAGQGHSFVWRRLHSLSGIFPIGAFLLEHFISNSLATNGVNAYNENVRFLTGLPFVFFLELFFIYIPLAYHAGYGFWIWWRGDSNAGSGYPWVSNWMYTVQRYTGIVAFFYIGWHVYTMRFSGVHLMTESQAAFTKVWMELQNPWAAAFYFVGILCASWHFGYGIFLFLAKWGIVVGERARKYAFRLCALIAVAFMLIGIASEYAFLTTPRDLVPQPPSYEMPANTSGAHSGQ
jgi:succinate dehydrogenase / fumarate reductase cytochrome b subunit